jgi:hypothetical protein
MVLRSFLDLPVELKFLIYRYHAYTLPTPAPTDPKSTNMSALSDKKHDQYKAEALFPHNKHVWDLLASHSTLDDSVSMPDSFLSTKRLEISLQLSDPNISITGTQRLVSFTQQLLHLTSTHLKALIINADLCPSTIQSRETEELQTNFISNMSREITTYFTNAGEMGKDRLLNQVILCAKGKNNDVGLFAGQARNGLSRDEETKAGMSLKAWEEEDGELQEAGGEMKSGVVWLRV